MGDKQPTDDLPLNIRHKPKARLIITTDVAEFIKHSPKGAKLQITARHIDYVPKCRN